MSPDALSSLVSPDPAAPDPLPVQIHRAVLAAIADGRLPDGTRLPSTRSAAQALGLSRITLTTAYDLLRAEGVLAIARGRAPVIVAPRGSSGARGDMGRSPEPSPRGRALARDFRVESFVTNAGALRPGVPAEHLFPREEWGMALRRAARRSGGEDAAYGSTHGLAALRAVLAERLRADRGLAVDPECILVTTGTQGSLSLLAQVMTQDGDCAAMEDPGFLGARAAFEGAGLSVAPIPVDDQGLVVEALPAAARLIFVTPSNQYPLGCRMSLERRLALVAHARRHDALILEDDYESEFLWRGRQVATLAAHAPAQVAYLGSAAKVLMPALRIGWIVAPPELVPALRLAQRNLGLMANLHTQRALAEVMLSGRYRAHVRRMARAYEAAGNALAHALEGIPAIEVRAPDGGVQLALRFRDGRDETAILAALGRAGFRPARLSAYAAGRMTGLIVGFGDAGERTITRFRAALLRALDAA
ncbi:PLP-dependent aminotransferase family protein [Novosphingobium sp. 1949]|uniref:PLP-dependent aminotransferase family protein n=1 Tax=Novosphingobium organovorum TaxID=2930092 RepID=A0ABT0BIW8_9SPHN|nr:PLP-dependent aminotransferase family protein [Novosphingobium organovorum]MCJ2184771.1 PLP-dependent aminotransferase family protein [Novosphingobium organovorum]